MVVAAALVAVQPLLAVTVKKYELAHKPDIELVVCAFDHKKLGVVTLEVVAVNLALHWLKQLTPLFCVTVIPMAGTAANDKVVARIQPRSSETVMF